jgi:O-antigen/teichoic acid export membrane protein
VLLALLPLALGGALLGDDLMRLLYGDRFPAAGTVCRILSVSYVALAVGQFFGNGLIATDRQQRYMAPLAVGAVVAVVSVAALARHGDGSAAAWGMLAAHVTLAAVAMLVGRDLLVRAAWRPALAALAGLVALALVVLALPGQPVLVRIAAGAGAYVLVVVPTSLGWLRRQVRDVGL